MHPGTFVYAHYASQKTAVRAVEALVNASFPTTDVGAFILSATDNDALPDREIELAHVTGVPLHAALGAFFGAAIGVLLGVASMLGARAILDGAVAGVVFGTLVGALGGLAFWRDTIKFPRHSFRGGAVVIGVNAQEARIDEAADVFKRTGGNNLGISTQREVRGLQHLGWAPWDRRAAR